MKKLSAVVLTLQNPKEKFWGILLSVQASGVMLRGIDLSSFEDWSRSAARGEREMGLSTSFFPMHRVERLGLDEPSGSVPSLAEAFEARVGQDVWSFLGIPRGLTGGAEPADGAGGDWLTLQEAESDYIERVLNASDWDRAAAAEILEVSEEILEEKIRTHRLRPPG